MTRILKHLFLALFLLGSGVIAVQANIFSKRPATLSTGVSFHYGYPVVFRIEINGQQITGRRSQPLNDLGGVAFSGLFDRSYDIKVEWVETLTGKVFAATTSVPLSDVSRHQTDGDHADLSVILGRNGAIAVETPHPDLLRLLADGKEDDITPEMDIPIRLVEACADPVASTDPRHAEMSAWIDDEARAFVERYKDSNSARLPDPLAALSCPDRDAE